MRFRCGLIVGKFSPLHRGHVLLIERALEACDELVLLSYAKPDYPGCGTAVRRRWLEALFPQARRLVVDDDWLAERRRQGMADPFAAVPGDGEPEDLHRRFTAWLAHGVLGLTCDAVFTSADYGDGFAVVLAQTFGHEVSHRHQSNGYDGDERICVVKPDRPLSTNVGPPWTTDNQVKSVNAGFWNNRSFARQPRNGLNWSEAAGWLSAAPRAVVAAIRDIAIPHSPARKQSVVHLGPSFGDPPRDVTFGA